MSGAVISTYSVVGYWSSRRLAFAYPEEWRAMKNGLHVAPDVKRRIDEELTRSMLIATGVSVAVLVPVSLVIALT